MNAFARHVLIAVVSVLLTGGVAWGQGTAELAGRVTDTSGAVLPGVTVTVMQTNTGFTRTVVTDATGQWVMPALPTGPYRLEVSLQGFRTYVQTGIVLQVGATPTINAALALGSLEETITVEAAAPIVDVRNAGISEVIEEERIVALPLQGRQVTDLIVLAGAAVQTGRPNSRNFQGGVNISVAGGLDFGVAYTLDGAMHNDPQNTSSMPLPFPDALQEFQVATSGLSAQNGVKSGASVNAVTKSGTNVLHGNAFEFLRDKRFNAVSPFAAIGPDGEPLDDGLKRHQFGGTLGGPIVRDRLFFFGAYQGTATRVTPSDNLAYVPTAAMLAGDFTAFTSPACNSGRQIRLGAPFVNNRVNPALFSPAAVNLARRLPTTDHPCGEVRFSQGQDRDEYQAVGRADFNWSAGHTVFGRYMATSDKRPAPYGQSGNLLTTTLPGIDNLAQSFTLGDTMVVGTGFLNALRFSYNRTAVDRHNEDFFQASDLGIDAHNYSPTREMVVEIADGFDISAATATKGIALNPSFQVGDDVTLLRGSHQLSLGVNVAHYRSQQENYGRSSGTFTFGGSETGTGLSDFLLGRLEQIEHGSQGGVTFTQWYQGVYAQDTWRATNRLTVNAGLRWEPFSGQHIEHGAVANFSRENFRNGIRSGTYVNAPAGFLYPGDAGFPPGQSGFHKKWSNLAPRVGLAWDASGDGRTAVRTSYAINYDLPGGETWSRLAAGPPFGNRVRLSTPPGGFDRPYAHLGGDPHPILTNRDTVFPPFGAFGAIDPDINSPRIQSWNVTVEQQLGRDWGVSASYLGSYSDRLWGRTALNPGVYLGSGPCTLNTVNGPVSFRNCTVSGNLDIRRALHLENPREAQYISSLDLISEAGTQNYRGLKLTFRRRAAGGVSLNGNYTLSRCSGLDWASTNGADGGFTNPADPSYDRGYCTNDRTHLANFTASAQTPQFASRALNVVASNWRIAGIVAARSGNRLTVTTGTTAFNGVGAGIGHRVDQVSDDVYGAKTLDSYLNRAAFANPEPGGFGNHIKGSIQGPGYRSVDVAASRLFPFGAAHTIEVRVEAFNLFNTFNWGDPETRLRSGNFGKITEVNENGAPRIMQFGIKYGF
jgi:hypothetical protein